MSESEKSFDEIGWVKFQFEQSWLKEGQPVDVREFAQNASPGDLVLLKELIVLNFDYWWEAHKQKLEVNGAVADEPPSVGTYLRQYPEIRDDDTSILELLIIEITNWPHPNKDDYVDEFPKFQQELTVIFDLLKMFRPEQLRQWTDSLSVIARALGHGSQTAQFAAQESPVDASDTNDLQESNAEPLPPLKSGQVLELLDQFRVIEGEEGVQIGEGAFKRVYKGQQESTGRPVAVKQLKQLKSDNVRSFLSEGRAQAALEHQSIPPVMLLGDQDGQPALLVEKLIQAPDWSTLIHNDLNLSQNLEILLKVSQAASYAHRKCDLVHRDIKPQNVLVSEFGEVYLVDWGLAVQVADEPKLDEAVRQLKEEPAGYILGPPAYMAPEMALGSNQLSTPATDVFLLGAILYEILTGHAPYNVFPRTAVLRAAAHWFPDLPDDAPEELKSIALRAMAKDPEQRYTDAGEFAEAIQRYQSHVVADEQTSDAERQFAELQKTLMTTSVSGDSSSTLTSLIAAADRYRLAGKRWADSVESATADDGKKGKPDEFTERGLERSLTGERSAREELVAFAVRSGDLALAESQVTELTRLTSNRAGELKSSVGAAKTKRRRERLQRVGAIAATVVTAIGLAISTAVVWSKNEQLAESNRNLLTANIREEAAKNEARGDRKLALEAIQDMVFKVDPILRNQSGFAETRRSILEKLPAIVQRIASRSDSKDDTSRTEIYTLLAVADITEQLAGSGDAAGNEWAEQATELRMRARQIAESRLVIAPDAPVAIRDGMVTLNSIADESLQRGDLETAQRLFAQSLKTAETLFALDELVETQRRRDLALACERLGDVSQKLGDFAKALSYFERQYATLLPLTKNIPSADIVNRDIAISLSQIGKMQLRSRRLADGVKTLRKSIDVSRVRATELPNDFQAQRDLADGNLTLGQIFFVTNQFEAAKPLYESAASILQTLTDLNPGNLELRRSNATALQNLGDLARRLKNTSVGQEAYLKAISEWDSLAGLAPNNAETHRKLIAVRINFSDLLSDIERLDDAIFQLENARQKCLERKEEDDSVSLLRSHILCCNKLGKIYLLKDEFESADKWFQVGLKLSRERAEAYPIDYEAQRDLDIALNNVGDLLLEMAPREALKYYGESKTRAGKRFSTENPESVQDLLTVLSRMGSAHGVLNEHDSAQRALQEGLELVSDLRKQNDAPHLIVMAAKLHRQSGLVYLNSAQAPLAVEAFNNAISLLKENQEAGQLTPADGFLLKQLETEIASAKILEKALQPLEELLKSPKEELAPLVERRAMTMLQLGRYQDALDAGSRLFELPNLGVNQLYNSACVFSRCAECLKDGGTLESGDETKVTVKTLQTKAIKALRLSIAAGWNDVDHMKSDADLTSLKGLPAFQEILGGKKSPPTDAEQQPAATPK